MTIRTVISRLNWGFIGAMLYCAIFWAVLIALLTGCASLPPEQRVEETVYQSLHLADTLQTLQIARHPESYWEAVNPIMGHHPTQGRVLEVMASEAVLHALVTQALVDRPLWAQRSWQALSIGWSAANVNRNARIGLTLSLRR